MESLWVILSLAATFLLMLYFVYHFIIKIYLTARKFLRMDSSLKVFVAPFTGIVGLQTKSIQNFADSHHFIKEMIRKNPNQTAFLTNIGSNPFLILCDAQLIKEMSQNPKKFKKFNLFKHSNMCYSRGIFMVEDDDWTCQRNIIKHSFNHHELKKMIKPMSLSIDNFIGQISAVIVATEGQKRVFRVLHDT